MKSRVSIFGFHSGGPVSLPDRELSRDIITRAINSLRLTFSQRVINCFNYTAGSVCD